MKCPFKTVETYTKRVTSRNTYGYDQIEIVPCREADADTKKKEFGDCLGSECAAFSDGIVTCLRCGKDE